ncbi:hypothetical protein Pcac1_g10530 [Phytophthora cactorum]|nr:hypothetical protein Pcac1_g10530 [Phytophthora cactorum]KAG3128449.1 hypothetical protein C6341_g24554 [Phytophthora cactorum]
MWRQEVREGGESLQGHANNPRDSQQQALPLTNSEANYAHWQDDQMDRESAPIVSQDASRDESPAVASAAPSRSGGDRNWGARIRASIARLMEIDGVSFDPESYAKQTEEKQTAKEAEQAFYERVDRLQAASEVAHKEHRERLRDVYSASTAKKMRLTAVERPSPSKTAIASSSAPPASWRSRHEALDTLAVAAATEELSETLVPVEPTAPKVKRTSRRQNSLPLEDGTGTEQNPVRVHDPELVKAVNKLADKLAQLLGQLQATSDAATAEPILAAAAAITLEATEMHRCEEVALARMVEIEEHRQHIMQGLLEYEMRKEQREMDESSKEDTANSFGSRDGPQDGVAKADENQA